MIVLDAAEVGLVRVAVERLRRALRADGYTLPAGLEQLASGLAASNRHEPTRLDDGGLLGEVQRMPLLVDVPGAATALGVSVRGIERLVADGSLLSVRIGGRRLIARDDLTEFVDRLRAQGDR